MKKKADLDMPIGKLTRVDDFLPSPKELVASGKKQKLISFESWEKKQLKDPKFRKLAGQADDDPFIAKILKKNKDPMA